MVQEKNWQTNVLLSNLQKIEGLIFIFEKYANLCNDTLCRSFLKNAADKKTIQLIILERIAQDRGIEIVPGSNATIMEDSHHENQVSFYTLEEIFNFLSRQSLRDLKLYTMLAQEPSAYKPIFNTLVELEEDFLIFIETDYINHLTHAATRNTRVNEFKVFKKEYENSMV
ncbi:MAG TPA: hypothetical protein VF335_07165 [Chitinivibrionales bacterium]